MLSAGQSLDHYVRNYLITKGATEVVKRTALAAFYSAVWVPADVERSMLLNPDSGRRALPAVVYKSAALALDNGTLTGPRQMLPPADLLRRLSTDPGSGRERRAPARRRSRKGSPRRSAGDPRRIISRRSDDLPLPS